MKTVLAISGGGVKGIIPTKILKYIETKSGYAIKDLFNVIAGTSIGSIIGLSLALPADNGTDAKYTANDVVGFFTNDLSTIFVLNPDFSIPITVGGVSLNGLFCPKWSSTAIEGYLSSKCGSTLMNQLLVDTIVSTYDTVLREPVYITNLDNELGTISVAAAARASSSAPTYWCPSQNTINTRTYNFIDGIMTTNNNPSLNGYLYSKSINSEDDVLLVSLGCGEAINTGFTYNDSYQWGKISWIIPLIDILFDSSEYDIDLKMQALLPETDEGFKRYWRFQPPYLSNLHNTIDDITGDNVNYLVGFADSYISANQDLLDELVGYLVGIKEGTI